MQNSSLPFVAPLWESLGESDSLTFNPKPTDVEVKAAPYLAAAAPPAPTLFAEPAAEMKTFEVKVLLISPGIRGRWVTVFTCRAFTAGQAKRKAEHFGHLAAHPGRSVRATKVAD